MSKITKMTLAESLTDETLLLRLRSTEHDFIERKPRNAKRDWIQVAVSFANSAPIGWPAVLFVGVDDDGNPQQDAEKLEDLEKSVAGVLDQAYPAIYRHLIPLHIGEKGCLAVVIPGSENRPHFAGKSYIRVGPETREASESQFDALVASRFSKTREIQAWIGKEISLTWKMPNGRGYTQADRPGIICVESCSPHYATFRSDSPDGVNNVYSEPLHRIEVSFDNDQKRLQIFIYWDR